MDSAYRATIDAFLDFFFRCAGRIIGKRQALFKAKNFRSERYTEAAAYTCFPVYPNRLCHKCSFSMESCFMRLFSILPFISTTGKTLDFVFAFALFFGS